MHRTHTCARTHRHAYAQTFTYKTRAHRRAHAQTRTAHARTRARTRTGTSTHTWLGASRRLPPACFRRGDPLPPRLRVFHTHASRMEPCRCHAEPAGKPYQGQPCCRRIARSSMARRGRCCYRTRHRLDGGCAARRSRRRLPSKAASCAAHRRRRGLDAATCGVLRTPRRLCAGAGAAPRSKSFDAPRGTKAPPGLVGGQRRVACARWGERAWQQGQLAPLLSEGRRRRGQERAAGGAGRAPGRRNDAPWQRLTVRRQPVAGGAWRARSQPGRELVVVLC